jgi:hypothetical protein
VCGLFIGVGGLYLVLGAFAKKGLSTVGCEVTGSSFGLVVVHCGAG